MIHYLESAWLGLVCEQFILTQHFLEQPSAFGLLGNLKYFELTMISMIKLRWVQGGFAMVAKKKLLPVTKMVLYDLYPAYLSNILSGLCPSVF